MIKIEVEISEGYTRDTNSANYITEKFCVVNNTASIFGLYVQIYSR